MIRRNLIIICHAAVIFFSCSVYIYGQFCLEFRKVLAYKVFINYTQQPILFCDLPICVDRAEVDCVRRFDDDCNGPEQWVAGIDEFVRPGSDPIQLQCCSYGPMVFSRNLGETELSPGEFYEGGYQFGDAEKTRITAYDLIKNIQRAGSGSEGGNELKHRVKRQGASYIVAVARINCVPPPPELLNTVDPYIETLPDLVTEMINLQIVQPPPPPPPPPPPGLGGLGAAAAAAGAGAGGAGVCFAADTLVMTPEGKVKIQDLKVGDHVLSYDVNGGFFVPVTSFWHYDDEQVADFIRIRTDGDGGDLILSDFHFIFVVSCNEDDFRGELLNIQDRLIYAKDLRREDHCLVSLTDRDSAPRLSRIRTITKERRKGIYAPITSNGRLVAHDIVASCFSVVQNPYLLKNLIPWSHAMDHAINWLLGSWTWDTKSQNDWDFGFNEEETLKNKNLSKRRVGLPFLIRFGLEVIDRIIVVPKMF